MVVCFMLKLIQETIMLWDDFIGEPDNFEKKRDYKAEIGRASCRERV